MKKLYSFFMLMLVVVLLPTIVLAEGNVAEVNGNGYATIEEAMTAAEGTDYEVKLLQDVTLAQTKVVNKDLTINLNNHSILYTNLLFEVYGAEFTVKGTGTLKETVPYYAPIAVYGSTELTATKFSIVNVESGVTLHGWSGIMVRQYNNYSGKTMNSNAAYGVEVNMAGKIKTVADATGYCGYGLYINGSITDSTNAPVINVADTTEITAVGLGIYIAGYGVLNVEGGTITGETGIEIRAGKLEVKGGIITGTGDPLSVESNGSGATTIGAGIAIAQHTTKLPIYAQISGGTITGKEAVKVSFPEEGAVEDIVEVSITGGTYSTDVKEYVGTGLVSKKVGDTYTVGKENSVTIGKVTAGKVEVDKATAVVGETVTLTLTPNEGYELSIIKVVDADNKEVSVTGNTFVMPDSNVTITVEFKETTITSMLPVVDPNKDVADVVVGVKDETKVEEVLLETIAKDTELAAKVEGTSVTVEVEIDEVDSSIVPNDVLDVMKEKAGDATITNFFDITIAVRDAAGTINETISELTEEIELMVVLPEELRNAEEGMERKYYIVREHVVDGKSQVDLLEAKVSEDGKYLVFKTDKFSTYAIAYEDVKAETKTPQTGDNVMLYIALGFISIAAIGISVNSLKRRNSR